MGKESCPSKSTVSWQIIGREAIKDMEIVYDKIYCAEFEL